MTGNFELLVCFCFFTVNNSIVCVNVCVCVCVWGVSESVSHRIQEN